MNDEELLNWAMNQLYRAARTMQLLDPSDRKGSKIHIDGCDLTAEVILKKLKKTKSGQKLILETNPKLINQKTPKHIKPYLKNF